MSQTPKKSRGQAENAEPQPKKKNQQCAWGGWVGLPWGGRVGRLVSAGTRAGNTPCLSFCSLISRGKERLVSPCVTAPWGGCS